MNRLKMAKRDWMIYLMLLPGLLYFLTFKYGSMWGIVIAFQDYMPFPGAANPWVGFKHFIRFFQSDSFGMLFLNTLRIALCNLLFFFPAPIVLALLLNEIRLRGFKRAIQTIIYIPHFMSWVVVASITYVMFATETGIVNQVIRSMGGESVRFLMSKPYFLPMLVLQSIWKESGWGTIIFLAALTGIDPELYEAAMVDGAGRFRQFTHITLPGIKGIIVTLLILRLGNFMDTGFEQIFLMQNALNRTVAEVFDTYVYNYGIQGGQYSYTTAIGLFKSVIGLVLVLGANKLAQVVDEEGIF